MTVTSVEFNPECNDPPERSGWRLWLVLCLPTFYYVQMWLRDDYANNISVIDDHVIMENFEDSGNLWNIVDLTTAAPSKYWFCWTSERNMFFY